MGSWVTIEALRQMSIRDDGLDPKIGNVILAAPDLDLDVFEQQMRAIGEHRPHITFLVYSDDRALGISKMLAGGSQRLGAINPLEEPHRSRIASVDGLTVIDLSELDDGTRAHHTKFAETNDAITLLGQSISGATNSIIDEAIDIGDHAQSVILSLRDGITNVIE